MFHIDKIFLVSFTRFFYILVKVIFSGGFSHPVHQSRGCCRSMQNCNNEKLLPEKIFELHHVDCYLQIITQFMRKR